MPHATNKAPARNWSYPFALRDTHTSDTMHSHFAIMAKMAHGFFPLAPNGFPFGGIHVGPATNDGFDLDAGVRCLADGEVIAYRLDSELKRQDFDGDGERIIEFSTGFVLVRHWLAMPPGPKKKLSATEAMQSLRLPPPEPEGVYVYSLYYYNRPFNQYPKDERHFPETHLPFWKGHRLFRVGKRCQDRQAMPADMCPAEEDGAPWVFDPFAPPAPLPPKPKVGLNIRAEGHTNAEIIGVLHANSIVRVEKDVTHGWARIREVVNGAVSSPLVGGVDRAEAQTGWVHVGSMDTAISPDRDHLNQVVVLDHPYRVKAGDVLGYLGSCPGIPTASRHERPPEAPLMTLEVFAGDDFPAFVEESRRRAVSVPREECTVLAIAPGARLPMYEASVEWREDTTTHSFKPLPGEPVGSVFRRGVVCRLSTRPAADLTDEEKAHQSGVRVSADGKKRVTAAQFRALKAKQKAEYPLAELEMPVDGEVVWSMLSAQWPVCQKVRQWKQFPLRNGDPRAFYVDCPTELAIPLAQLQGLPPECRAIDENGVRWWRIAVPTTPPRQAWVSEDHPAAVWTTPVAWPCFELVDGTTFSLLEAYQRGVVVSGIVHEVHEEEFQAVASALSHHPLIVKLAQAIDAAGNHDGSVSLSEFQNARATPALAQRLSRLIVKMECQWSDDLERWDTLDHIMTPDWKHAKDRQRTRAWWSKVASKIPSFPQDPRVWHMHPLGWVDNFAVCATSMGGKFSRLAPVIFSHEGGYVDNPNDKGGPTNLGISWQTWKRYAQDDLGVEPTVENLKKVSHEQALIIYSRRYWIPSRVEELNDLRTCLMVYDWIITSRFAVREIQRVLKVKFGSRIAMNNVLETETIAEINRFHPEILGDIADARKEYYRKLAADDSRQNEFLKGWITRVNDCLARDL